MRVREMEKVLTTSLISMVHTHPQHGQHMSGHIPARQTPVDASGTTDVVSLGTPLGGGGALDVVETAKDIVRSHEAMGDVRAVQASKRSLKELEYSLDQIDKRMATVREKNRYLQRRYKRIKASINREIWASKVRSDSNREMYLASLASEQASKYQLMRDDYNAKLEDLLLEKQSIMTQHEATDETVAQSIQAGRSLERAIGSLKRQIV